MVSSHDFACMNDDRLFLAGRDLHLLDEDGSLGLARGEIVMVVEPDFSNGDYFGVPREIRELLERIRSSLQAS